MNDLKNVFKIILVIFVLLFVLGILVGGISNFNSPPSVAGLGDNVTIDIGGDGYLVAHIEKALEYNSKNIADGEVQVPTSEYKVLKWIHAKNVSYVDYAGKKGYAIVWKASPDEMGIEINNTKAIAYDYGEIFNQNHMFALYYLQYNPQNKMIYGIILDNNVHTYDLSDLLYGILGLSRSDVNYHEPHSTSSSSSHYRGVDNSPHTIARNDPDWYYDHYDYGDYDDIDEYLESQGY